MNEWLLNVLTNHPTALVTATSMVVATFLGVLGFRIDQSRQKKLHTLTILSAVDNNQMLVDANFIITKMMIEGHSSQYEELDKEQRKSILTMLNYYEFISTALSLGALDEKSLLVQRYGLMRSTFDYFKPFIDFRREKLNRPHAFDGVEFIVRTKEKKYKQLCLEEQLKWDRLVKLERSCYCGTDV